MNNVILCGPPGVGKSTIGKKFAQRMKSIFIDLDDVIEAEYKRKNHEGLTCRQIYQTKGPHFFRDLEKQALEKVIKQKGDRIILALGGGALERTDNIRMLKEFGQVVYLSEKADILYTRVTSKGLPAYLDPNDPAKSFQELLEKRRKHFEEVADKILETQSKTVDQITDQLMEIMGS